MTGQPDNTELDLLRKAEELGVPARYVAWAKDLSEARDRAPIFVAFPINAFFEDLRTLFVPGANPKVALFSLCELAEAVTRFVALIACADTLQSGDQTERAKLFKAVRDNNIARPQFGNWIGLLRSLATHRSALASIPDMSAIVDAINALAPKVAPEDQDAEIKSIIRVRNALAHGSGAAAARCETLLQHWGPRVVEVLARCDRVLSAQLWMRGEAGVRRFNGANPEGATIEPPAAIAEMLTSATVVLQHSDHLLRLHPLGRLDKTTDGEPVSTAQLYARRGEVGLVYMPFGSSEALQVEGAADELTLLDGLLDLGRRLPANPSPFRERDFDREFERDAHTFVGRGDTLTEIHTALTNADGGLVAISGSAGIGKSALCARVLADRRSEISADSEKTPLVLGYCTLFPLLSDS